MFHIWTLFLFFFFFLINIHSLVILCRLKALHIIYIVTNSKFAALTQTSLWNTRLLYSTPTSYLCLSNKYLKLLTFRTDNLDHLFQSHFIHPMSVSEWVRVVQSYPTFCNPVDRSFPGSSVHGILQTRILECVAISFSTICQQLRWKPMGTTMTCFKYMRNSSWSFL